MWGDYKPVDVEIDDDTAQQLTVYRMDHRHSQIPLERYHNLRHPHANHMVGPYTAINVKDLQCSFEYVTLTTNCKGIT